VVICLERGADLHMAQLMLVPLTVSCFSKIQTGFTFLVPAHLGSPGQRAVKWVCVFDFNRNCVSLVLFLRYSELFVESPTLPAYGTSSQVELRRDLWHQKISLWAVV